VARLTFGKRLCAVREYYGLTQQDLADRCGAGFWTVVSRWENNIHEPSAGYLARFANALRDRDTRINIDWLVTGSGDMTRPR